MRPILHAALISSLLVVTLTGCKSQTDPATTNRLNAATSTGNSQQATEPPTNPTGQPMQPNRPMQP